MSSPETNPPAWLSLLITRGFACILLICVAYVWVDGHTSWLTAQVKATWALAVAVGAAIVALLTDARKASLQAAVLGAFRSVAFGRVLWLAWACVLILPTCINSLEVHAMPEVVGLDVRRDNAETEDRLVVPFEGHKRHVYWSLPFAGVVLEVSVTGFAPQTVALSPWSCTVVDWRRFAESPRVLVRPSVGLLKKIRNNPKTLRVTVAGQVARLEGYKGESVWVGAPRSVEVPVWLVESWRNAGIPAGLCHLWSKPRDFGKQTRSLKHGNRVLIELVWNDSESRGKPYGESREVIARLATRIDRNPTEIVLEEPEK